MLLLLFVCLFVFVLFVCFCCCCCFVLFCFMFSFYICLLISCILKLREHLCFIYSSIRLSLHSVPFHSHKDRVSPGPVRTFCCSILSECLPHLSDNGPAVLITPPSRKACACLRYQIPHSSQGANRSSQVRVYLPYHHFQSPVPGSWISVGQVIVIAGAV